MDKTYDKNTQETKIADRYVVHLGRPQPAVGGCEAFEAHDINVTGTRLVALAPRQPRARLPDYAFLRHDSLIPLQAQEYQDGALWVICPPLPGPPLSAGFGTWSENQLIEGVIRPIADLLTHLSGAGMTCRTLRLDNLFQEQGGRRLFLGPLGLTPPGMNQPVVFEPLSSAVCAPGQRAEGTIACDVFALGVVILSLCTGGVPLADLSDEEILRRRFERGSAAAYMAGLNIPSGLVSLLTAMLSDNPEFRPSPKDLVTIAPSKMFSTRVNVPARMPLVINGAEVRTPQALAWYATRCPDEFLSMLKRRAIGKWLHHELDMVDTSRQIERLVASGALAGTADPRTWLLMQAIALLDPSAPLCWGGRWFWPEALPGMIARALGEAVEATEQRDIMGIAGLLLGSPELFEKAALSDTLKRQIREFVRLSRRSGPKGKEQTRRIPYDANWYQPCLSPLCLERRISQPLGLARWLEASFAEKQEHADVSDLPSTDFSPDGFLDEHMRSFLEMQCTRDGTLPINALQGANRSLWLSDLSLIATVQQKFDCGSLPHIAKHAVPYLAAELCQWRSRTIREQKKDQLIHLAEKGNLQALLTFVHDPSGRRDDRKFAQAAEDEIAAIRSYIDDEPLRRKIWLRQTRNMGEFFCLLLGIAVAMSSIWMEFCQ